jgi:hypothetical protein
VRNLAKDPHMSPGTRYNPRNSMADPQSEFVPTIVEDETPGSVVILSPSLAQKLKACRDAEGPAAKPDADKPSTGTTS